MSVMELSHRSPTFGEIIERAEADLRALLGLSSSSDHVVLFLQGGASLQFSMVPANLRPAGASADYLLTGSWSRAALKEADKTGTTRVAGSTEATGFDRIPAQAELDLDPEAAYLHFTSNNTIYGTQWAREPEPLPGVPLVCDASSDVFCRPFDITRYGLVYAGAQKNLGPAGVTVVVMKQELLERTPGGLPALLDYGLMAAKRSLYNTPPTFGVYVVGRVLQWLRELGGLAEMARRNEAKAALLYQAIDTSGGFYRGHAQPESRSLMNVTFRLGSEELEKGFLEEATAAGLTGLKGHRSVGGLRASVYNACPIESVQTLVEFMAEFRRRRG
jgi:phosphoserine aminotransferase